MRYYEASSMISSSPEAVWAVLTDAAAWPSWAFRVREEYTGPLLGLIWRSMPDLGPSFDRFAQGLKRRAEEAL
jgi:uncharacterized protein YndB with AHSA1/START domain